MPRTIYSLVGNNSAQTKSYRIFKREGYLSFLDFEKYPKWRALNTVPGRGGFLYSWPAHRTIQVCPFVLII